MTHTNLSPRELSFLRRDQALANSIAEKEPDFDFGKIMGNPEDLQEPQGTFRFMDLPAELRVCVYSYLLPCGLAIKFQKFQDNSFYTNGLGPINVQWRTEVKLPDRNTKPETTSRSSYNHVHGAVQIRPHRIQTQILLLNKEVCKEIQAILYGSNSYTFTVTCDAHWPVSMQSPQIFGPFGTPQRLPLLRNLRSIIITVSLNDSTHWGVKRQRARLEYFVSVLKQHADNENKKSLLQSLCIHVDKPCNSRRRHSPYSARSDAVTVEKFMFGLESLTGLRGIKDVRVTGVPDWYAQCLELSVQGNGGDVHKYSWPFSARKKWNGEGKAQRVSVMKWWQPTLDWREFAARNGLEVAEDLGKFWMVEE